MGVVFCGKVGNEGGAKKIGVKRSKKGTQKRKEDDRKTIGDILIDEFENTIKNHGHMDSSGKQTLTTKKAQ